jgi:hypothetical protein
MIKKVNKRGFEPISMIILTAVTVIVLGVCIVTTRRAGSDLYPAQHYPYQGKVMIGTNEALEPKW